MNWNEMNRDREVIECIGFLSSCRLYNVYCQDSFVDSSSARLSEHRDIARCSILEQARDGRESKLDMGKTEQRMLELEGSSPGGPA